MSDYDEEEFKKFLDRLFKEHPELQKFNLEFLKNADPSEMDEIIENLKEAAYKFKEAEISVRSEVEEKLNYNIDDLEINFDNFLETITIFPFALTINSEMLKEKDAKGRLSGKFFGMYINFKYDNVFELLSIRKIGAMKIASLMRNNFFKFLPIKQKIYNYIKTAVNNYLKATGLVKYFEIDEIREFNMLVILRNKLNIPNDKLFEEILSTEENEKYYMMKAYFITEFAIAVVEKDNI